MKSLPKLASVEWLGAWGLTEANTGSDAKTWWWYAGESISAISGQLSTNGARLVDLSHNLDGTFNAIMVKNVAGTFWKWYVGANLSSLVNSATQTGYRIFDLQPYTSGGFTVYAALEIDNLAAENRARRATFESKRALVRTTITLEPSGLEPTEDRF